MYRSRPHNRANAPPTAPSEDGKEDDRHGWMSGMLAGKGSSAAVAFLCTKALGPIRTGITFTATPLLHRYVCEVMMLLSMLLLQLLLEQW